MKRQEPVSIGQALCDFFDRRKLGQGVLEGQAVDLWTEVVGSYIAESTEDVYIRRGVIYVKVTSPVVRMDLSMRKAHIIAELNRLLGTRAVINLSLR